VAQPIFGKMNAVEKSSPKLENPKVNNRPKGENSSNPVTLVNLLVNLVTLNGMVGLLLCVCKYPNLPH
jgi:hypothetical protein